MPLECRFEALAFLFPESEIAVAPDDERRQGRDLREALLQRLQEIAAPDDFFRKDMGRLAGIGRRERRKIGTHDFPGRFSKAHSASHDEVREEVEMRVEERSEER